MFYWPLDVLLKLRCETIVAILGGRNVEVVIQFCEEYASLNKVKFIYVYQDLPLGLADALRCAELPDNRDKVAFILGDNIYQSVKFQYHPNLLIDEAAANVVWRTKDRHLLKRSGIATLKNNFIVKIKEKPTNPPKKAWISTGLYIYPNDVFGMIEKLKPSKRDELEITDLNNLYAKQGRLFAIKHEGLWQDVGVWVDFREANR